MQIKNYLYGLAGGVFFVLAINSVSALIGLVHLSWPSNVSSASDAANQLKFYVQLLLLCGKGLATATGVALVEELLFRSWLPNEIAIDLGYYRGIIISGLAFSLSQRYLSNFAYYSFHPTHFVHNQKSTFYSLTLNKLIITKKLYCFSNLLT